MATNQSNPYEPTQRLIDNPTRLRELFITKDLGYRTIANKHAQCSKSTVRRAIQEYGIDEEYEQVQREKKSRRGLSPPQPQPKDLEWSDVA
jgi:predicted secreted protein